jgi:hypothetical protein
VVRRAEGGKEFEMRRSTRRAPLKSAGETVSEQEECTGSTLDAPVVPSEPSSSHLSASSVTAQNGARRTGAEWGRPVESCRESRSIGDYVLASLSGAE